MFAMVSVVIVACLRYNGGLLPLAIANTLSLLMCMVSSNLHWHCMCSPLASVLINNPSFTAQCFVCTLASRTSSPLLTSPFFTTHLCYLVFPLISCPLTPILPSCSWALPPTGGWSRSETDANTEHQQSLPSQQYWQLCAASENEDAWRPIHVLLPQLWVSLNLQKCRLFEDYMLFHH